MVFSVLCPCFIRGFLLAPSASQLELAEWGLFPEENVNFWIFGCHLAEGGGPATAVALPGGLCAANKTTILVLSSFGNQG